MALACRRDHNQGAAQSAPPAGVIPAKRLTPEVELSVFMSALQSSGPAPRTLSDKAIAVADEWKSLMLRFGGDSTIGATECYAAGCATVVEYRSRAIFDVVNEKLGSSSLVSTWPGARFRSGPIVAATGAVVATWILYSGPVAGPG
jgi:hypothetical protein